ncbi:MAG TPA: acyl-CoA dehydrogenase [Halieaceae bacterium]|uniref:acyl-CoA dehydrogenase family protein n=1 Tax=Haliea TaxID=475794 RepID=UPI000C3A865F|nr:acyl-CoA dehydrogenase [Haliea sp.]MAY94444.1 acyl-CoA dehydrogenase [Haliea sp.]MBP70590.1 acyl-CoA dehydrogenase [Haliea sp.]HBQ40368.1 acyl-CoA dehydrogenase [Halieaceae bacterium]HCD55479.1 acyl-CoA dehydrogenase [Halieaceae bacterium]
MQANKPADPGFLLPQSFMEVGSEQQLDFLREWQHKVWSAGYLGMAWPREYGGQGVDPVFQSIADQEMRRHAVPICFNVIGLGWAGPLINDMGTEAEKARYLKGILTGEDIWCQGFSEPDHGSDLGNAQLRARRDGDEYVLNGTKIWTTMGNFAKYMILLARTNPEAERKYDGLSFFLAPMQVAGVDPRPIRKLTGEYGFTETFFTDARIPASCLMGEEGQGWKIAMKTLQYERGAEAGAAGGLAFVRIAIDDMIAGLADVERDGAPALQDPAIRDQLVQMIMEEKAVVLGDRRAAIGALTTDYPFSLPLSNKLRFTESTRRMRQLAINLQGADGGLYVGDEGAREGGFWQRAYLNSFSATIGGGTSQVQANIIAEHILGLPK